MKEFQKGQKIKTVSGGELEIIQKLGEGGQGVVYKVRYNGRELALKWYFSGKLNNAVKFYDNIQNNIKKGAPTPAFLWPLEITEYYEGSFGYLMRNSTIPTNGSKKPKVCGLSVYSEFV